MGGKDPRITGTLVELHLETDLPDSRVGAFGLIRADGSGRCYVWGAGAFYRDGSTPRVGCRYAFDVVDSTYATNVEWIERGREGVASEEPSEGWFPMETALKDGTYILMQDANGYVWSGAWLSPDGRAGWLTPPWVQCPVRWRRLPPWWQPKVR